MSTTNQLKKIFDRYIRGEFYKPTSGYPSERIMRASIREAVASYKGRLKYLEEYVKGFEESLERIGAPTKAASFEIAGTRNQTPLCTEDVCQFTRSCAQHVTAGDFRSEGGDAPELTFKDGKLFCSREFPEEYAGIQILIDPTNPNSEFQFPEYP